MTVNIQVLKRGKQKRHWGTLSWKGVDSEIVKKDEKGENNTRDV